MVPDAPSLTRRRLLGSLAGVTGAGTVAVGATEPTLLPDVLTDEATKHYPTPPEVDSHWRPTVTEAHAREAVELLADTVAEGRRRWRDLDTDERFHGAGGWLDDAREALRSGDHPEALFDATYGMQFAGEALGVARARQGEADLGALADRAERLDERVRAVVGAIRPYPVADPGRDLAWYYEVEQELALARLDAPLDEVEELRAAAGDDGGATAEDPHRVGSITAGLLVAEMRIMTAERWRDHAAELVGGDGTPYADHLGAVADRFRADLASFPSREEIRTRYVDGDDDRHGPYEFAHWRLAGWCFDGPALGDWTRGLRLYRTVDLSRALAKRRAHGFAVEHLVVGPGDEGFDSGHVLAEKRRARSTYRDAFGSEPPALLTRQARRAVEDLQVAAVGFADSYDRPLWRERLAAYLYALVGRAKLEEYPAVYDAVVDRE